MNKLKFLLIGLAGGLLALAAVACSGAATPTPTPNAPSGGGNTVATGNPLSAEIAAVLSDPARFASAAASVAALSSSASQVSGIWVTGTGEQSLKPDLAIVGLGVQADGVTVAEARDVAANAMTAVVEALKKLGIAEKDIQTAYFSIQPQYTYRQVTRCPDVTPTPVPPFTGKPTTSPESCYMESEQVLVGYQVNNTVTVKVRNLDIVGQVVDAAALAGGDATRVNYVSFTVEDSKAAQAAAREEAVKDALAKAQQFAQLTGVKLGRLLYITESGGVSPTPIYRAEAFAGADAKTTTPISAGELDVSVSVQAVFAIE